MESTCADSASLIEGTTMLRWLGPSSATTTCAFAGISMPASRRTSSGFLTKLSRRSWSCITFAMSAASLMLLSEGLLMFMLPIQSGSS